MKYTKEESRKIAMEAAKLYFDYDLTSEEALERAKEVYENEELLQEEKDD